MIGTMDFVSWPSLSSYSIDFIKLAWQYEGAIQSLASAQLIQ